MADRAQILALVGSGKTYAETARITGRSRNAVAGVVHREANPYLRKGIPMGEAHVNAKLTDAKVREIRRRRASGERLASIAADVGVNLWLVCRVGRGRAWTHVTDGDD